MTPIQEFAYPDIYPAEMYKDDLYRVVFSGEGVREWTKKGWSLEIPSGKDRKEYKVFHHEAASEAPVKRGPGRPKAETAV